MTEGKRPPPERPKRGVRTRNALIAAGHKLLAERSIDALAVNDIVQEAGVAKGSFYNHFEHMRELAATVREDLRQEIEKAVFLVNANIDDPAMRVARAFTVYFNYILLSPQRANVLLRINAGLSSTENLMTKGVLQDIGAGQHSGRFAISSVHAGALFVIGACHITLLHTVEDSSRASTIMIAQNLGALMLRGLGVEYMESEALIANAMYELVTPGPSERLRT